MQPGLQRSKCPPALLSITTRSPSHCSAHRSPFHQMPSFSWTLSTRLGRCPHTPSPVHSFRSVPSHALAHSIIQTDLTHSIIQASALACPFLFHHSDQPHPFRCSTWHAQPPSPKFLRMTSPKCLHTTSPKHLRTTSAIQSFWSVPSHALTQVPSNDLTYLVIQTNALGSPRLFSHVGRCPRMPSPKRLRMTYGSIFCICCSSVLQPKSLHALHQISIFPSSSPS